MLGSRGRGFDVRDETNDVGSDEEEGSLSDGADNVACHSRLHVSMAKNENIFVLRGKHSH